MKVRPKGRHPENRRPPDQPSEPGKVADVVVPPTPGPIVEPGPAEKPKDDRSTAVIRMNVGQVITLRMLKDDAGNPFIVVLPG
jgi:hypothetical protein